MDYEIDSDICCPKCGHSPTHYRHCSNIHCDDGYVDDDDDPEWPETYVCDTCHGLGVERWCPQCGADLLAYNLRLVL